MKTAPPYTVVAKDAPEPQFQLTVITVCWNVLGELKSTVESVLRQKAKGGISIEHVVVDGASTDGTPGWLAEQLAAGNIERYVSEPDRGIYDAMNKGINLARGQVLAFLNAGDTYRADAELAPCVLPICSGETESVAASANVCADTPRPLFAPKYHMMYVRTPCCHQSFFASATMYRKLGGYDTGFKCGADVDMFHRIYNATGTPLILDSVVVDFEAGGFSNDCRDRFRNETVELVWRNWERTKQRCREDAAYNELMVGVLCHHAFMLRDWQQTYRQRIPEPLEKLQTMCREMAGITPRARAAAALRFLAGLYLPRLAETGRTPGWLRPLLRVCHCWCIIPRGNPYAPDFDMPGGTLTACILGGMARRLGIRKRG